PKQKPGAKPPKPKFAKLADLPKACALVLNGPAPASEQEATYGTAYRAPAAIPAAATSIEAVIEAAGEAPLANIPVPSPRPGLQ
ncbi:penicillin-insensitive murein endopeptidase, partial [Sinorhizobium meliloti]